MAERCKELPDECWEVVFDKLGHHSDLQTLILVCKRFLSIISHLRTVFNLNIPAVLIHGENLSTIFNRFPNIKSINLRQAGDSIPRLLDQITTSSLTIQSLDISEGSCLSVNRFQVLGQNLKSLRVLKCSAILGFSNRNLAVIANSVPWVEELDISYPRILSKQEENIEDMYVTDCGIEMLSSKMTGLRKIDISGYQFVTDKSLMFLSSNCVFLEQVVVRDCAMISGAGIQFLVRNSPNLASLTVRRIDLRTHPRNLLTIDCFSYARCLSTLDIEDVGISNDIFYSLSVSGIPLKSFTLVGCYGFTCYGIAILLKRYPSLEYLSLTDAHFPDDTFFLGELSSYICKLTAIKLKVCYLTESTFFMLAKSCPLLEDIDMGNTLMGAGESTIGFISNTSIKSLNLSCNSYLSDECLAKLALACPFLEMLDVSYCSKITEKGVSNILNHCSSVCHLEINGCEGIKSIGEGIGLPKLEVLRAKYSGIDDEGLAIIGKRCYELLNLVLAGCLRVTTEGLKGMLGDCRRLREINLKQCLNVSVEIMDWMVFSMPSLRKIIPPYSYFPDFCQMQFYLHHGCYVWSQTADEEYEEMRYCHFREMWFRD